MTWTYFQSSGKLCNAQGAVVGNGYSGFGDGKNNPALQAEQDVGPIPQGDWIMTGVWDSPRTGPFTIVLQPAAGTDTFGRSDFRIHGDSSEHPGCASHGCIILPRPVRERIWASGDHELLVNA